MHWLDPWCINNQQMHHSIYDVFHLQCYHLLVSTAIAAIFRVILLQEYGKNVVMWLAGLLLIHSN
jgi:hypothetical protein